MIVITTAMRLLVAALAAKRLRGMAKRVMTTPTLRLMLMPIPTETSTALTTSPANAPKTMSGIPTRISRIRRIMIMWIRRMTILMMMTALLRSR